MLWFLTAAAAPVLIHLWNKRKHREIRWAAMEYLLAAMRNNSRRITIEQLILLLVRMLIVVLLALAVAEPFLGPSESLGGVFWPVLICLVALPLVLWLALFSGYSLVKRCASSGGVTLACVAMFLFVDFSAIDPLGGSAGPGRRTHRVFVIDGSYSMAYRPADKSLFERAGELAARIVDASSLGDGFTLILMSDPPRVVVGTPVFDKNDFLGEIQNLRLPHGGGNVAAALSRVDEVLRSSRRDHPKLTRQEVYFISDLGRNSWRPSSPAVIEQLRQRAGELAKTARLVVYDLGQDEWQNTALTGVRLARSSSDTTVKYATTTRDVIIRFDLQGFSAAQGQQLVHLWVDGHQAGDASVDVGESGRASGEFAFRFDTPGDHEVEVRLPGDGLDVDDRRFMSVPVKQRLKVLVIEGRRGTPPFGGSADYLMVALTDSGNPDRAMVEATRAKSQRALLQSDLNGYDAIFCANVAQFSVDEARVLRKFLTRGGGLVFFLGDAVQPDNYNNNLAGGNPESPRVLPATIGDVPATLQLDPGQDTFLSELDHEIVKVFAGNTDTRFVNTPVRKYFPLTLVKEKQEGTAITRAVTALKFTNARPVIVEERIGRGRSILVATSAGVGPDNDPWTYMPTLQNFLPLVREMLSAAVVGKFESRNKLAGEPLSGTTGLLDSSAQALVETPWKEKVKVPIRPLDDHGRWSFTATDQSGFYRVEVPRRETPRRSLAVNVDTKESDLAKVSQQQLEEQILTDVPLAYHTTWQDLDDKPAVEIVSRRSLHWWLLVGAVTLMFTETLLGWLFARD